MSQIQGPARKSSQEKQKTESETRSMQEKGLETRLHITQVHPGRRTDKKKKTGFGTGKPTVLHMLMTQMRVSGQ